MPRPLRCAVRLASASLIIASPLAAQAIDSAPRYAAPVRSCADTATPARPDPSDSSTGAEVQLQAYDDYLLAKRFAPILRFAPGERYFPTIPFFTAFDPDTFVVARLSNRERTWVPADSIHDRYAARGRKEQSLASLSFLRDRYLSRLEWDSTASPHTLKVPHPAVLYRVCDLAEPGASPTDLAGWRKPADAIWRYLRSDAQSWSRFGLDTMSVHVRADPSKSIHRDTTIYLKDVVQFRVVQYYFYYMADWGLQGHAEDIEYALVFVPRDPAIARRFRIVVGAGHDPPAPNNVMVYLGADAERAKHLNQNILVELGGHSSAPDMPPFGQFSAGLDVNWHIDDVWGTRDEQASGGISFAGRYEGVMTYPRDPEDAVTLFPRPDGAGTEALTMLREQVRVALDAVADRVRDAVDHPADSLSYASLADSIVQAYDRAARLQEASTLQFLILQTHVGAGAADTLTGALQERRRGAQVEAIAEVLRASDVPCQHDCDRAVWLQARLDEESRYLPSDELAPVVAGWLQAWWGRRQSDRKVGKQVAAEVKAAVSERLKPEYTLLALDHLHNLVGSAVGGDTQGVWQYLAVITRTLFPSDCKDFECRAPKLDGQAFRDAFRRSVCGEATARDSARALESAWPRSLACRFDSLPATSVDSLVKLMARWDQALWDARWPETDRAEELNADRHEIWKRQIYRNPGEIFRSNLFRPTKLQVLSSREAAVKLFPLGVTVFSGHAWMPTVGLIVPAAHTFAVPMHIPGYLEFQFGLYAPSSGDSTSVKPVVGLMYDRRFTYFWGWYVRGLYVFHRKEAEDPPVGSDFTWTAGPSLWLPKLLHMRFVRFLHFRPGLRFDTQWVRPTFRRVTWEFQLEYRR
jgi:hypothetical protein